ncbi:exonuclease domain-containing protein [Colidextribacter sp. OB.20]|uniref:exonuclease domain-containing protein n=1 Tax=Colidextribacter sp. OB.20 TaxID=2304568 RepID=UPI0013687F79|nr:exonuclease domain-containing protein [Colidextribacter sp. OB.20]
MYVLMDLEWFCTDQRNMFPTQIAALRVDKNWQRLDLFFSRIKTECANTPDWTHMAFSGGAPEDFLSAPALSKVLRDFRVWLHKDDVLCWWAEEAPKIFKQLHTPLLQTPVLQAPPAVPHRVLLDHVSPVLASKGIKQENPYKIAAALELAVHAPAHCSEHDVLTIRTVLQALDFPQENLGKRAKRRTGRYSSRQDPVHADMPYQLDATTGLLHRKDCDDIPDGAVLSGFASFKPCFNGKARPCPRLTEEYRSAKRKRKQNTIARSQYNFVYVKTSPVFHRRDCSRILSANSIMGSIFYEGCTKTGRRPCRLCKPSALEPVKVPEKIYAPVKPSRRPFQKNLPNPEQRAIQRLKQSQEERRNAQLDAMTDQERADLFTLTQPGYAFWAAAGYQTFHRRDCRKLKGLSNLKGFSRFSDASRAGYTPCKLCKPTKKQDMIYSIPITSQKRQDESVQDLVALCEENQFTYSREAGYFTIRTPLGRWRIHLNCNPIVVDHINLTTTPDNPLLYHRQPRLFLSLADIFSYIKRHDKKLLDLKRQPLEAT